MATQLEWVKADGRQQREFIKVHCKDYEQDPKDTEKWTFRPVQA